MKRFLTALSLTTCVVIGSGCHRPWKGCVSASSMIETPGGPVRAMELRPGDLVTSITPEGDFGIGTVLARRTAKADRVLSFTLSTGQQFTVTDIHPIARTPDLFVPSGELKIGEHVTTPAGQATITNIQTVPGEHTVIDFSVHPHNNFIANGVLAHNKTLAPSARPADVPGRYLMPGAAAAIEFTETNGRLVIARPPNASQNPGQNPGQNTEEHSAWRILGWKMVRGALTADLEREQPSDWLSGTVPGEHAKLTAHVRTPFRPRGLAQPTIPASIHMLRIESDRHTFGLPGNWIRTEQIDAARSLLDPPAP